MLKDYTQFFGRSRELRRIMSRIGSQRPQSVSVVGERRIGKSSLLNALTWPEVHDRYLEGLSVPIFIYLDLQSYPELTPEGFFQILLEEFRSIEPSFTGKGEKPLYQLFTEFGRDLRDKGRSLVVLLDEFDVITSNTSFGTEFYSFLRSGANNYPVAYVTSSRVELQKICHSSDIADSPFFNIFSNLYLGPFSPQEASELIRDPSDKMGAPLTDYQAEITDLAGFLPFFLQIACSVYFDAISEDPGGKPEPELMEEIYLEEAVPHFRYMWEHFDAGTKGILEKINSGRKVGVAERQGCRRLVRKGLLRSEGTRHTLFSKAFSHFLAELPDVQKADPSEVTRALDISSLSGSHINQYRILEKAGEGGMGVVYAAEDTVLRRRVALKCIQPKLQEDQDLRKRVYQEARLAASLNHPRVTSIYELFEFNTQLIMVMEWIEGQNLKHFLKENSPMHWKKLARWMIEACEGLEAAHKEGIIHRDIKSSNLMITEDGHLKITDFGLAKSKRLSHPEDTDLTAVGSLLGTLGYMSPEQVRGEAVDSR
ncbi:MAG: protein kinase, partial [Candidatus Bathyarchaeota archaeon]|nr:protein kinase [Candidatus Bathyarchaeota archaeon]